MSTANINYPGVSWATGVRSNEVAYHSVQYHQRYRYRWNLPFRAVSCSSFLQFGALIREIICLPQWLLLPRRLSSLKHISCVNFECYSSQRSNQCALFSSPSYIDHILELSYFKIVHCLLFSIEILYCYCSLLYKLYSIFRD